MQKIEVLLEDTIANLLKQECDILGVSLTDAPYRFYYRPASQSDRKKIAICFPCADKKSAMLLFCNRHYLAREILRLHCGEWVFAHVDKKPYPGWEVQAMSTEVDQSDGDLLKRVADAPYSSGIVDISSNRLIWGSRSIQSTAGRTAVDMLTQKIDYIDLRGQQRSVISGDQNATWEGHEQGLFDLNRQLLQEGVLENYSYSACTWDLRDGIWYVKPVRYVARLIEVATLNGRNCRVTSDVRIVE